MYVSYSVFDIRQLVSHFRISKKLDETSVALILVLSQKQNETSHQGNDISQFIKINMAFFKVSFPSCVDILDSLSTSI